ncbi:hypothetical protein [Kribbella speibonae]|uniref:Uncharacterized protein n=1 Tax=Kribbella speibonae TaxID=1572660 RepID=A0A4R0IU50_9ACTN|nr:hypothetical protein [Kribbella speibonae]TCC36270.1 hypothetical protein E0H92_26820 [Kribbella speibonae]
MARAPLPIGTWGAISTWVVQTDAKGKPISTSRRQRSTNRDWDDPSDGFNVETVHTIAAYPGNPASSRAQDRQDAESYVVFVQTPQSPAGPMKGIGNEPTQPRLSLVGQQMDECAELFRSVDMDADTAAG